jgi:hypothetical protein
MDQPLSEPHCRPQCIPSAPQQCIRLRTPRSAPPITRLPPHSPSRSRCLSRDRKSRRPRQADPLARRQQISKERHRFTPRRQRNVPRTRRRMRPHLLPRSLFPISPPTHQKPRDPLITSFSLDRKSFSPILQSPEELPRFKQPPPHISHLPLVPSFFFPSLHNLRLSVYRAHRRGRKGGDRGRRGDESGGDRE